MRTLQVVFSKQDRKTPREMAVEPGYGSRERSPGGRPVPCAACTLIRSLHAVHWKDSCACPEVTIVCRAGPQEAQPEPPP